MKITLKSANKRDWYFLFLAYFFFFVIAFKVFGFHVSTLGDYRLYGRGTLQFAYSPEVLTINIYTILSSIGLSALVIGSILFAYISYVFVQNTQLTKMNILIFFSIMNPFTIQFLIYPSKELILICLTLLVVNWKKNKLIDLVFLLVIFFIRPGYFLVVIATIASVKKRFFKIGTKGLVYLISFTALLVLIYIEYSGYTEMIIGIIRQSFLPYTQSTTNRNWIPIIETILSINFLIWFGVGLYTVFFGFTKIIITALPIMITGVGKLLLLFQLNKKNFMIGCLWFIAISIYAVPLSVYNIGSSLRYSIPIMVMMLYTITKLREQLNECR